MGGIVRVLYSLGRGSCVGIADVRGIGTCFATNKGE